MIKGIKINKEDIDFTKIYKTSTDAQNNQNAVKVVYDKYFGDNNGDLYFDKDTGAIYENNNGEVTIMGYTNEQDLKHNATVGTKVNNTVVDDNNSSTQTGATVTNDAKQDENKSFKRVKINKEDIDFTKLYKTEKDANNNQNAIKGVYDEYFGDTGDLYFDKDAGAIYEDNDGELVLMSYANEEDILKNKEASSNETNENPPSEQSSIKGVEEPSTAQEVNNTPAETVSEQPTQEQVTPAQEETVNNDKIVAVEQENPKNNTLDQEYYNELLERYKKLHNTYGDTSGYCGYFTRVQLQEMGLVGNFKSNGKNLAKKIANNPSLVKEGYTATGYETNAANQIQTLEKIISDNNGSVGNMVVSFNGGGNFKDDVNGHSLLVYKIENGYVYFIDNWDYTKKFTGKDSGKRVFAIPVSEFEQNYLKGNRVNCFTVISKNNTGEETAGIQGVDKPEVSTTEPTSETPTSSNENSGDTSTVGNIDASSSTAGIEQGMQGIEDKTTPLEELANGNTTSNNNANNNTTQENTSSSSNASTNANNEVANNPQPENTNSEVESNPQPENTSSEVESNPQPDYASSGLDLSTYHDNLATGFEVTTGNKTYDLSDADRDLMIAVVCGECGGTYDDALAVASSMLNRCEDKAYVGSHGTNPIAQITAPNQYEVYLKDIYKDYMPGGKAYGSNTVTMVSKAVDDALNGVRNNDYTDFRSNKSTSYSDNMVDDTGNRFNRRKDPIG